ncbi:MAG: pseudouridine synthase [Gammaproteobacteria bacterium]|nr:pseudouridine synthase [Gammaproteobacteria bacterium]MDH5777307.1 pseudouridine synthase [Gammaproteobacteria bacterium]
MSKILLFNKPFDVLSQFRKTSDTDTLSDFIKEPDFYPAGRLDKDSEGLLLLTNDGELQHQISHPLFKMPKTYWVQVEGDIDDPAIEQLQSGIQLKDGLTKPAKASKMAEPNIWTREPPIRYRVSIPDSWLSLTITEGRNRQVRRMTAATGFPTLRLIRYQIGPWTLDGLEPGQWRMIDVDKTELKSDQIAGKSSHHRRRSHRKR